MQFNQNSKLLPLHYVVHSLISNLSNSQRKALFQFWVPDKLLNISSPIHKTSKPTHEGPWSQDTFTTAPRHVMRAQRQALPSKTLMQLAGWNLLKSSGLLGLPVCHQVQIGKNHRAPAQLGFSHCSTDKTGQGAFNVLEA